MGEIDFIMQDVILREGLKRYVVPGAINRDGALKISGHNPRKSRIQFDISYAKPTGFIGFRLSQVSGDFNGLEVSDELLYSDPFTSLSTSNVNPDVLKLHLPDNNVGCIVGREADFVVNFLAKKAAELHNDRL